jgi:fatty-acid desaturase
MAGLIIPSLVMHFLWPEVSIVQMVCTCFVATAFSLHSTLFINSAAHRWGTRAYDKLAHLFIKLSAFL